MTRAIPVKWFEWTDEAFRKAQAEEKPIVLSIGAAWCHGCRLMDASTYSDPEVARLLNGDYVPVYVDSDRRPDINERYNTEGWPTTAFLTPAGAIMGAATFLPPEEMLRLLSKLKASFASQKLLIDKEIARRDAKIAQAIKRPSSVLERVTPEIFRKTVRGIVESFDPIHAGFGNAPKFPLVASLRVVLQAFTETGGPDFSGVVTRTLDAMGDRGMFDAIEGGFFRYAKNQTWAAPQFEKMGEDNAGLIRLYLDAAAVTGTEKYRDRARQAAGWVKDRLCDRDRGVFFGSESADEKYYLAAARTIAPHVDRTVYTPVSAAMASAFLRAAQTLGDASYAELALRGLDFLLRECMKDGEPAHYHDGAPRIFGLAVDRTALASALLDAYDHTGDARWLDAADATTLSLIRRFWSDVEKGIVDRLAEPGDAGELARPRKNIRDNALAAENFARLWRHRGNDDYRAWSERILLGFPDYLDDYGHFTAEYALAADRLVNPPNEVDASELGRFVPRRRVKR